MTIRYVDIFTGISATSCALRPLGFVPVAFAEIDDFASAVIRKHYPDVPNLGDVCDVDWSPYKGNVDLVVGGSPCFTAGTLVMCESGLKPIEEVQVGELVLTHKGNLRRVLSVGSKTADTVILKGQGSIGIECTKNHPFFSRTKTKTWVNEDREYRMVVDGNPEWISAENMEGRFWLNVCNANTGAVPEFAPSRQGARGFGYIDGFIFTPEFFYFVGRWLGDGWTTCYKRKGRVDSRVRNVHVCCSYELADELEKKLLKTGLHFCRTKQRTTERFTCHSVQLYDWIVSNFGVGAGGKNIPTWCLQMDKRFREAIVQGYFESDGHRFDGGYKASTISRKLSIGMKMLCGSIGIASSVTLVKGRGKTIIEGRVVNEHESYVSSYYEKTRSAFFADTGFYGKVRSVLPGRDNVTVYNLEVEGDHSYTADGIAVHNCQAFSVAGTRGGLSDPRGRLMFEYVRCVRELMPQWFVWENVPGALTVERGKAFEQLLAEMDELGYGLAWRILDAQFHSVAQRRQRLFLVGHLGDMRACEVLFEPESLRWDTPSVREQREALARAAGRGTQADSLAFKSRTGADTYIKADGKVGTAGKGALVSEELAFTLATTCDQSIAMSSGQANAEITTDGLSPTLTCLHEQPIVLDRASFNQGENAQYPPHVERTELMDTLVARGPHAVAYSLAADKTS